MSKITSNSTYSKSNGIFNFRFLLKIHFKANAVVPLHQSSSPALLAAFQMEFIKSIEFITLLSNAILSVECVPNSNPPAHIPMKRWYSNQFQLKRHQNTLQIDIRSNSMNIYSFRLLSSKCLRRQITVSLNASTENMETIRRIDSIQIEKHLPTKRSANCFWYECH